MAERVRWWSETGGSPTTTANTLAPGRTCLLCACAHASVHVWAIGCVLLAAISLGFLRRYRFRTIPVCVSVCACVCILVYMYVYLQCNSDAKRDHDVAVLAKENYFKEAYGMC